MADSTDDLDTYALASMIADHLRGIPVDPAELPPGAHRLVAAYVARHDYGAVTMRGRLAGVGLRFTARDHTGAALPEVPVITRGEVRVIDHDDGAAHPAGAPPARVLSASGGQPPAPVARERKRNG